MFQYQSLKTKELRKIVPHFQLLYYQELIFLWDKMFEKRKDIHLIQRGLIIIKPLSYLPVKNVDGI